MITLYTFGPAFGLPDPSPLVVKVMMLLKLAGVEYIAKPSSPRRGPKLKIPFIKDDGVLIGDSTFIRFHLEKTRGVDFDKGLTPEQKAQAWAIEKMCEEHLYWIVVCERWQDDENFERGPARFFDSAPALLRPFVKRAVRRYMIKSAWHQGVGRHAPQERAELGRRDVDALATLLGDKPYICGETPCGADATVFGFVASLLSPAFKTPTGDAAMAKPNLVAYRDRMMRAYFPDCVEARA